MSEVRFEPMGADALDWVATAEQRIYPFPWTRTNFAESLTAGYSCWLMRSGGELAGYAVQMLILDETHLLNLSVLPELQGRGLGSLFLHHLCLQARLARAEQMFLEVRESNRVARGLYRKWGFEAIGRRKGYYPAVEGREDAIVMRRML